MSCLLFNAPWLFRMRLVHQIGQMTNQSLLGDSWLWRNNTIIATLFVQQYYRQTVPKKKHWPVVSTV